MVKDPASHAHALILYDNTFVVPGLSRNVTLAHEIAYNVLLEYDPIVAEHAAFVLDPTAVGIQMSVSFLLSLMYPKYVELPPCTHADTRILFDADMGLMEADNPITSTYDIPPINCVSVLTP